MPKLGKRSKQRLEGVDNRLVELLERVCKYFDITIIEGKRSQERQDLLVKQGKSKTKFGKHVDGKAVDIAIWDGSGKIDWNARDDFHMLGGFILGVANQMGLRVRWGGCWRYDSLYQGQRTTKTNNFDDLVHIELVED